MTVFLAINGEWEVLNCDRSALRRDDETLKCDKEALECDGNVLKGNGEPLYDEERRLIVIKTCKTV